MQKTKILGHVTLNIQVKIIHEQVCQSFSSDHQHIKGRDNNFTRSSVESMGGQQQNQTDAQNPIYRVKECTEKVNKTLRVNDDKTILKLPGFSFWLSKQNLSIIQVGDTETKAVRRNKKSRRHKCVSFTIQHKVWIFPYILS